MNGTVGYAGQEPWIFSATIRENILINEEYIPHWYNTVIHVCALDKVTIVVLFKLFKVYELYRILVFFLMVIIR